MPKRTACIGPNCVACGCCLKVCPRLAIQIDRGIVARVDETRCIGCGLCAKACPAGVIDLREVAVPA